MAKMISGNVSIISPIDKNANYLISESPEHYQLHNGNAYSVTSVLPNLNASSSTYLEIITPANKQLSIQGYNLTCDQLLKSEFFELPTITDGTNQLSLMQRNRPSSNTALTKIYTNPTTVSGGTLLRTLIFGSFNAQGNSIKPLNPTGSDALGFSLKSNTKYVVRLTNLSTSVTNMLFLNLDVYEY